jgi:hypothetical protein
VKANRYRSERDLLIFENKELKAELEKYVHHKQTCNIQFQYVRVGKHLHDSITSLRVEVLAHKTSLTSHILLKCLYQARKISCHVFVLGISTFPLSTILIFDFVITFLIGICFDSDLRRDSMYQMTRSLSMNKNRKGVLIKFLPTDHQMECESGSNLQASRCK